MQRPLVLTEAEAKKIAHCLRTNTSFGDKLLSASMAEEAYGLADELDPLVGGPWRPDSGREALRRERERGGSE